MKLQQIVQAGAIGLSLIATGNVYANTTYPIPYDKKDKEIITAVQVRSEHRYDVFLRKMMEMPSSRKFISDSGDFDKPNYNGIEARIEKTDISKWVGAEARPENYAPAKENSKVEETKNDNFEKELAIKKQSLIEKIKKEREILQSQIEFNNRGLNYAELALACAFLTTLSTGVALFIHHCKKPEDYHI